MRSLLNTLFVTSEDLYLALEGENVVVLRGEAVAARFPLHTLESILCFSYKGASPALMGACAQRGICLSFYSPRGKFYCQTSAPSRATCSCGASSSAGQTVRLPAAPLHAAF